ncbi:MAG TPA: hypothetical protein VK686_10480 [Bryobacteraceae bacterium]|nr:hypothetical protein [Bryobacteraceae bacterium]
MSQKLFASSIACTMLLGMAMIAQDNPPPAPSSAEMDLTGIPSPRGIYYRAGGQWVILSSTLLMPFSEGRGMALEILNVGSDHTVTEIPGAHSGVQIGSDARPTFYLHGISPANVYLVRAATKTNYRELRMPVSRHFGEWAHFNAKDVTDMEVQAVNGDVVAIRPSTDLKPGEYALASAFEPGAQWVRLGFDFGIAAGR